MGGGEMFGIIAICLLGAIQQMEAAECQLTGFSNFSSCHYGDDYRGIVSRTKSGYTCQKWSSQYPHRHRLSYLGDHNYCRIDTESRPWCYTTSGRRWDFCDTPSCGKGGSSTTIIPLNVTMSSIYDNKNYGPERCVDRNEDTFCQTKEEENPFIAIEYTEQIRVNEVKVTVTKDDCCFSRSKEMVVIITDTKPIKGQLASKFGTQLGSIFKGPATEGGQVIRFKSPNGAKGKYVVVQLQYTGIINLARVEVNPSLTGDCYMKNSKYSPIDDISGQGRTAEESAEACKARCLAVSGCAYFSFWNDGGCHLSSSAATPHYAPGVTAGSKSCLESFSASLSSEYSSSYPAENCLDGNEDTFCHTEDEENPYFVIEYNEPIRIFDVKVTARKNCCFERAKEMVTIVTNTKPTKGKLALDSGSQLGTTFKGPATKAGQVITFSAGKGIIGKYVIVQQQYKGVMNLAEVQVNRDHDMGAYLKNIKTIYTHCIENPECEGCEKIVKTYLPNLLQENIIKEGEIGINNGSLDIKNYKRDPIWPATLGLLKGEGVITKRTNASVTINGTVSGMVGNYRKRNYWNAKWRSTGLYAGPGDLLTLTLPEELVGKVSIRIGHEHNFLYTVKFPCASFCKIGSPFGGLIGLNLLTTSYKGTFTLNITNAISAPNFIFGTTTNEQWKEMRHYSPKWAVLRVPGQVEIFVQTLKIKDIKDMNATMARIKLTMDALEDMLGLPSGSQPGEERIQFDPGLRGGYHVGCGMCWGHDAVGDDLYTEDKVSNWSPDNYTYYDDFFKESGTNPLILHEFGHGYHYDVSNGFPGISHWVVETVSSYIRYVRGAPGMEGMTMKDLDWGLLYRMVGYSLYSGGKPCGKAKFNNKQLVTNGYDTCYKWLYWIPCQTVGWHVWKDVSTLIGKSTKHYNNDMDRMIEVYCQATKHNMLPVFSLYNIEPSDQAITKYCQELPEHDLIKQWLNIVKCVKQSISTADKDIRDCAKMPRFPQHKGLCVITGVCHNDETNNGDQTMMNEKFDLYGTTGKYMSHKNSTENEENCFGRAKDFMLDCKNNIDQPITATYYRKKQGNEFNYDKVNYTFPPPVCENLCSSKEGCPLAKNRLLTILPELKMEFNISFEFRATAWQSGWQNVIHFTEGGNCCNAGARVPGFWVNPSGRLHPCFAVGDNGNYCTLTTKAYSLNTWYSVEISQTLKNGKYMYRFVVDREDIFAPVENTKPRTFSNVKVFAADNFYNPLEGSIRNLLVNTGCGDEEP